MVVYIDDAVSTGTGKCDVASRGVIATWRRTLRIWFYAARVPTLTASLIPVLVGSAAAHYHGAYRPDVVVPALLAAILIQLGTNLTNDYYDFARGADGVEFGGQLRVLPAGLLTPRQVALGAAISFSLAFLVGLYPVYVGGWQILVTGLVCIAAGIGYTGGPWPLGYHGLGDLLTFVFFGGVAVIGTYYLHTGYITALPLILATPIGCLVTAILVNNNIRDIESDKSIGKITLAVILGKRRASWQYTLLLAIAFIIPVVMVPAGYPPTLLLCWLSLPLAYGLAVTMLRQPNHTVLGKMMGPTALLHLLYGLQLTLSLVFFG